MTQATSIVVQASTGGSSFPSGTVVENSLFLRLRRSRSTLVLAAALAISCAPEVGPTEVPGSGGAGAGTGAMSGSAGASGVSGGGTSSGGFAGGGAAAGRGGAGGNAGASGGSGNGGAAGATGGGSGNAGEGGAAAGGASAGASGAGQGGSAGVGGSAGASGAGGAPAGGNAGRGGGGNGGSAGAPLGKFVGNIDTRGQVRSDLATYWNQLSPENAGKWGSVERNRDQMNWASLDAMYAYAQDHGIPFKQHTFVWGSQQPTWIDGLPASEQRAEVEEWIRLYCERFPDTPLIDVVNEPPPHTEPAYMAALGGAGQSGWDWIVQSFKWARQYCPNAILILNDYNNIELTGDNNHTIDIVKRIQAAGAPIDAVGAQAHGCKDLPVATVKGYIDKIASETGLPVYITEFDLDIADDNRQKEVMQGMFTMFWNDPNVPGITLWGYIQGSTWQANSGLMGSTGTMRPAMTWLMDFLNR
jgi:endo-1,4-beta-xylanase